jgi:peptidoglycan/LPS O-acetylase OafA/YrhL
MKQKILNNIQFLRGISVLLVFFYHLKLNHFDYGFLGVDIFFVISGFVISSMIYKEINITKNFNFYNFYLRRFKRIYPALFFVLSISFIFIIFFQPLDLFLNNLKVYFFSLLGVSNFYYLFSKKDYFDTVFEDPFAHTWSLGVEEQFYLIFPIFFFCILKYIKFPKEIYIIIILIITGGCLSNFFENNIKLIFYSPLFRFWEFLIGSLTFFLTIKNKYKNNNFSILALISLILFIFLPKNISLPNTLLITCSLTSIFILFYEENKNKLFSLIVENKSIVFLGNISYSFYLWHLPVLYFFDLYFLKSFLSIPLLFFTIFLLSLFSFNFIEKRFRYSKFKIDFIFRNLVFVSGLIFLIILINIFAFKDSNDNFIKKNFKKIIYNLNYLENKINYTDRAVFYKININGNEIYRFCTETNNNYKLNSQKLRISCLKKGLTNKRIFFIEGDSHTANFIPMFNKMNFSDNIYYTHRADHLNKNKFNYQLVNNLLKDYDEVVYTTNINDENSLINLQEIQKNLDHNIKILILGPIPIVNSNVEPLKCFIKDTTCEFDTNRDIENRNLNLLNLEIKSIIDKNSKFNYFNPYNQICPFRICKVFDKDKNLLTHIDDRHLTIEGSYMLIESFTKFYNTNYKN